MASDSNPRWLTKHLPSLASSRKVPLIYVKDNKGGSLRLGQLVKLKKAMAIGIKVSKLFPFPFVFNLRLGFDVTLYFMQARGNGINQLVDEILHGKEIN